MIDVFKKSLILIFDVILIGIATTLIQTISLWFSFLFSGLFLFPLLRAFGVVRNLDEREKAIDNLSSNIALAIVFVLAMFYIGKGYEIGIDGYISFILIPFTAKAFFSLVFHFAENRRFRSKEEVSV